MRSPPNSHALVTLLATSMIASADPLATGAEAPKLTAIDQDGKTVDFAGVLQEGHHPRLFLPESQHRRLHQAGLLHPRQLVENAGSRHPGHRRLRDPKELQKDFEQKNQLPFKLVADTDGKVAQAFGVPLMGKVTKRQSFLIKNGKVVWNMLDKTSTDKHAEDVLKANTETPKKARRDGGSRPRTARQFSRACDIPHRMSPRVAFALSLLLATGALADPPSAKVLGSGYRQMLAANPAEGTALDRLWKAYAEAGRTGELIAEYRKGANLCGQAGARLPPAPRGSR